MKPKSEIPTPAEWGLWIAWASRAGISPADRDAIFGKNPKEYSREQAAQRLAEYARSL